MRAYLIRRIGYMVLAWWILSGLIFIVIQLPPGDYLTTHLNALKAEGLTLNEAEIENLRIYYGLDRTPVEQYFNWITRFVRGDMGRSFGSYGGGSRRTVLSILQDVVPPTMLVTSISLILTYLIAVPIGIYSATNQYSLGDYAFTSVGFIGLATPNFMIALVLMYFLFQVFNVSPGGLFSPEYLLEPWSLGKLWDMINHLWVPVFVVSTAGTAGLIRVMRGVLLDELGKQYVMTARAKGVPERQLLFKYPVRIALNPIISTVGWTLPAIVSGSAITAIVLNIPMTGAVLLAALRVQDMHLAGSILMVEAALTIFGTLLSDVLLVVVDPRIRQERTAV